MSHTSPRLGDKYHPGESPDELIFIVCYKEHHFFDVKGRDILYTAILTKTEAKKNATTEVPTLEGGLLSVEAKNIDTLDVKVVSGKGLPDFEIPQERGI